MGYLHRETILCPACDVRVEVDLDADISLPPTGGDFDWCDSTEGHDCPNCGANLGIRVRVWLGDLAVEVCGIEVRPPRPVAEVPDQIRISPSGKHLVGCDFSRFWRWNALDGGWSEPSLISDDPLASRESSCPTMAFSDDGRLLLSNGRLFGPELELEGTIELPDASLIGLGWLGGRPALAWRELRSRPDPKYETLTERYWVVGIQRHPIDAAVQEVQYEAHSGIVMSGRHLFADESNRIYRFAPPRHGSSSMTAEILMIEAGALAVCARNEQLSLARFIHREGGAIVLGDRRIAGGEGARELVLIDAQTLEPTRRIELPADIFGDFDSVSHIAFLDDDAMLVSTFSALARVRVDAGIGEIENVFDLTHIRSLDARNGRAVVATDWELVEIAGDETRLLPLPAADE